MTTARSSAKLPGLSRFSPAVRNWFTGVFEAPTRAQVEAWEAVRTGKNALVIAPTGSGKTLAAFLWSLDQLAASSQQTGAASEEEARAPGVKVLYISPLKALGVDVERNLRAPLAGIREQAVALGETAPDITVGVRSGDTTPAERRRLLTHPPDILITTPESLYLLLTSKGTEILRTVETVIVDEVHAVAGTKRGAHLALSLERLDELLESPAQRIGLSATVEPAEEVARFLGGAQPVKIVRPPASKEFDITVEVPVEDMTNPPMPEPDMVNANSNPSEHRIGSMWPAIEASLYERIVGARSTIVFTNSRRLAERLTSRLNQLHAERLGELPEGETPKELARAHHGSVSKEARAEVEDALKAGTLRCVVATASLELGIDMGEVDLVVQIDPPPSVSSGLQRLGRSGHQVGGASTAVFYPTHRSKLLETAAIASRMQNGEIESLRVLTNPLDVLAQQTVARSVAGPVNVDDWYHTVRKSAPFASLPRSAYVSVLDLISGKYPSTEFASLRARVDWDREANIITARPGAQRLAVTNGGTIPDRGLFRVVTGSAEEGGTRVGELDEEMVYETRVGEVFTLGTTPWRVRQITKDTVEVEPAFGVVAKTPFWRGDSPSRPIEVGRAVGELTGSLGGEDAGEAAESLVKAGFDEFAVANAVSYVKEQVEATGNLPTGQTLVVERTRDEVGDWLLILQSPLGLTVHAPWALAINARLRDRWGLEGKAIPSNDGIIVRLPDFDVEQDVLASGAAKGGEGMPGAADVFLFDPGEIRDIVREETANSALFAARFREASARALILGASKPGKRSPLWQQRLRASALLEVAAKYPDFPMILEALREVLQDVYNTEALAQTMAALRSRQANLVEVATEVPSPFARSLLFGYVGEFVYAGDTPVGERRIAALSVDPEVLRELLGEIPLSELLEGAAIEQVTGELQRTWPGWQVRGQDGLVDLLRALGPLTKAEILDRVSNEEEEDPAQQLVERALADRQIFVFRMGGEDYFAAVEDAGILVSAVGIAPPRAVPASLLRPPEDPVRELLVRHVSAAGPFVEEELARRFGLAPATVRTALRQLETEGTVQQGLFLPEELATKWGIPAEVPQWVHRRVLDRMRARSLAVLRGAVEPVGQHVYASFLEAWQYCDGSLRGSEGVFTALEQLARYPLPASVWETLVLPLRVGNYRVQELDELVLNGEMSWVGAGSIGSRDGWIQFLPAGVAAHPPLGEARPKTELEREILAILAERGALFASAISAELVARDQHAGTRELVDAIWALVWDGLITSDAVAALRARVSGKRSAQKTSRARPRGRSLTRRALSLPGTGSQALQDPSLAGRWSLTTPISGQQSANASATLWAVEMLERYGVVTRGSVSVEEFPGGFAQAYRLYSDMEVSGTCRRGYFIDGLGAAQFAAPGAIDRLRALDESRRKGVTDPGSITLAVVDPANPYGAALPWPETFGDGAQPKRNPGALITLVGGLPVLYVERGGKTALVSAAADSDARSAAAKSLVKAARRGNLATFTIEKINGEPVRRSPWADDLLSAGFGEIPRGLTLRRKIQ